MQRLAGALALFFGLAAHQVVLLLDRAHAVVAGLGDEAGDLAGARRRGVERFVEQAGETLQPLLEVVGPRVQRRDQRLDGGLAAADRLLRAAVAHFQKLDRFGKRAPLGGELRRQLAEIAQHLRRDGVEGAEMLFHLGGGRAALVAQVVHGGDEFGHPRRHGVLDRVHVLVRAAQDFLQQDIGFAQALEQRGGIGAQHAVGFQHVGDRRRGRLLRFFDRGARGAVQIGQRARNRRLGAFGDAFGAFLQLAERARHRRGGVLARFVDEAGDLLAVVHHRLREDEALGLDRLHRMVGDAADFAGEFLALAGQRRDQPVRLLVEQAGHFAEPQRGRVVELVGLADDVARNHGAGSDQEALGFAGAAADRLGRGGGGLGDEIGRGSGRLADCLAGGRGSPADGFVGGRSGLADRLAGGRGGPADGFVGCRGALGDRGTGRRGASAERVAGRRSAPAERIAGRRGLLAEFVTGRSRAAAESRSRCRGLLGEFVTGRSRAAGDSRSHCRGLLGKLVAGRSRAAGDGRADRRGLPGQFVTGRSRTAADHRTDRCGALGDGLARRCRALAERFVGRRRALADRVAEHDGAAIQAFDRSEACRRALAERVGGIGGKLDQGAFGVAGVDLDRFGQFLDAGAEQIAGGAAAHFQLLRDRLGAADEQMLELADAAVERIGDLDGAGAQSLVDIGNARADRVGQVGRTRIDQRGDVGDAPVERGDHLLAALGKGLGDVHDAAGQRVGQRLGAAVERFLEAQPAVGRARW